MVHDERPVGPNAVAVVFDDDRAVSDAGVMLIATLCDRLGILGLTGRFVRLGNRVGAANAGGKVMSLIYAMVVGAGCIDDTDILRSGSMRKLLGIRVSVWNTKVFDKLHQKGWQFSIGVPMTKPIALLVAAIDEHAWRPLKGYPKTGEAQIAETTLNGRRLIVRRVRLIAGPGELFPREWRHFPFATNRTGRHRGR